MLNGLIRQVEHQRRKPVSVERVDGDILLIEGVRYACDLFREFSSPSDNVLYAIERGDDGVVKLTTVRNAAEAEHFFDRVFLSEARAEIEGENDEL